MFTIIVRFNGDWIDLDGVTDVQLFKALSDWSSGKEDVIKIKDFSFVTKHIVSITISR